MSAGLPCWVDPPTPFALMAIFFPLLFSPLPLLSNNRHDVSQESLRIGFMLQKSKIPLQPTPIPNLHASVSFFDFFPASTMRARPFLDGLAFERA